MSLLLCFWSFWVPSWECFGCDMCLLNNPIFTHVSSSSAVFSPTWKLLPLIASCPQQLAFFLHHYASSVCFVSSSFLWSICSIFTSSLCFCFLLSFRIYVRIKVLLLLLCIFFSGPWFNFSFMLCVFIWWFIVFCFVFLLPLSLLL